MGPLIDPDWLAAHLEDPDLRVADTRWYLTEPGRGRREYEEGHIPGAIFLDLEEDLSAPEGPGRHPLTDLARLAERLGAAGIGDGHRVVAYDDSGGAVAARLWWLLRHLGHRAVAVLDGGFAAWREAGLAVTAQLPFWPPAHLSVRAPATATLDREALAARLGEVLLLDARDPDRYRGEREPVDPKAGHIPTARSAPYRDNLAPDGRFLSSEGLRRRYRELGAGGERPVVAYCGSGVNACHALLALELAGLPEGVLYPGSWSDWSTAGGPVAVGEEPGEAPGRD